LSVFALTYPLFFTPGYRNNRNEIKGIIMEIRGKALITIPKGIILEFGEPGGGTHE